MIEDEKQYSCPCCGFLTISSLEKNSYEICPVCYWEVDMVQNQEIDFVGGANEISLRNARKNFTIYGAIDEKYKGCVRNPLPNERPDTDQI